MNDLTVIYLTANEISDKFFQNTYGIFIGALPLGVGVIFVSKKSVKDTLRIGNIENIITDNKRSHVGIYRDALLGAKAAKTKYIAFVEDDVLYSPEHFKKRPSEGKFAYNTACWSIYTWSKPPIFSYTGRRNFGQLICERDLFIAAMEERFEKYPTNDMVNNAIWAEPGKYESQLGVKVQETETFYTDPANIMFTHPEGLSMNTLGMRKRLAPIRAFEIPYWGRADKIVKLYE